MSLQYWATALENPTLSVFPHDYLRPQNNEIEEAVHSFQAYTALPAVADATPFTTGLAMFAALIYRLTGDDDVLISTDDEHGREFVLRLTVAPEMKFSELVSAVTNKYKEQLPHAGVDYEALATFIAEQNDLELKPQLFRLSFQHSSGNNKLSNVGSTRDIAIFAENNTYHVYYNAKLFKPERLTIFGEQVAKFFANVTPETVITHVNLVTESTKAILPDPTANLGWGDFRGAIQDIFQENAAKFPERTCVVETGANRVFTYKQINEASNIVGNYLVQTGIKRGDVVMIYSSRGVDLMVSVMGVLKAGATFSVIDPAYPPARQNIYLSVAKPRGLIVIKNAGVLDQLVEDYIKDELDVISRVPAIEIQDDGSLSGGEYNGEDVFKTYTQYADKPTGVVVGPDSNPTLSFTSGSEGIPKGVLGRHFSLAYYFDWMSQQFHLSENDKFTMLSGIAHDPIQRDMFTPLFLGAQLLVPTADDIGTPGKLAEWMAQYGATVTHLTPAMGQLLSAQATAQIPSLHHAFFVGDILTKRDCLRLQTLAENCTIVNMYGTTETQRAVSFFEVSSHSQDPAFLKSQKDVMPAGKGMFNVQLLVVNRNDRTQTCGIGEVGEIYVRAGGLAEGYRGLPDLNAEKFVKNWYTDKLPSDEGNEPWREFWLGPRDRLYRTGDLGRYLPDGNTECCGRADDQVKIRGFRIELGEIDTHISQHPLVRENITLVRKNLDNEPTLITFMVPRFDKEELASYKTPAEGDATVKGLLEYHLLVKELKEFLKKRLATYAIPTLVVVVEKLPLNPNGKVDKPKLQFPTAKQLAAVSSQVSTSESGEFTETETEVRDLWLQVLPTKPTSISADDSFFDLGGHSILATKMIFELREQLNVDLPLGTIFKFPTIKAFAAEVSRVRTGTGEAAAVESVHYYEDAQKVAESMLEKTYQSVPEFTPGQELSVFLTGATGFLGSYIIRDLLARPGISVYAHVRAANTEKAWERLISAGQSYGVWKDEWKSRIHIVLGDLAQEQFGLGNAEWTALTEQIDVIIHNGALVHWVYPYDKMRDANVISSVNVLNLAAQGKAKSFNFVSTTSTIDNEHYLLLDEVKESDDLMASAKNLHGGYGQTKWAAEYIIREAGKRGLRGAIIRPSYVTGASDNGSSNTDDFLLRFWKSVIQLGKYPTINNLLNMTPVDHVARIVTASSLNPQHEYTVNHVMAHPRIAFQDYLGALKHYGYAVEGVSYDEWKKDMAATATQDNALFPLLHMVLDNLPHNARAATLNDANTIIALQRDAKWTGVDCSHGKGVTLEQIGIYLSYLNRVGFLPKTSVALPEVQLTEEQVAAGGRGRGSAN